MRKRLKQPTWGEATKITHTSWFSFCNRLLMSSDLMRSLRAVSKFSSSSDILFKKIKIAVTYTYFDLVLMFKIINNISDLPFEDYFYFTSSTYFLRSHSLQIKTKENANSLKLTYSYFGRIPSLWNALPENLVTSPSVIVFKSKVKTHLLNLS